ncbi:MAG TPA: TonB-dependent receptor, partial [Flavobacteriaceae bacterium]|nr:TonB-dependent receptor [Flavobacteriaceae bacterium]
SANKRTFSNFNFLLGVDYEPNRNWDFYATFGTNFRLPTAIELAANGIHHGSFRHELGNPNLNPERGFVIDGKASYQNKDFITAFSPFVYYFTNYIFLQPSGTFSPLPHGGQIYNFTQSEAMLTGFEYSVQNTFFERWNAMFVFEYLHNQQITSQSSRNFPLPFSPPANGFFELGYRLKNQGKTIQNTEISVNTRFALRQNRIAQNEKITDGYTLFGFELKTNVIFSKFRADLQLKATNLLNIKYLNHTNFYRALEIPEMGRNIQLVIKIPFGDAHG